jgi:uncharacterized protein YkwD
MPAAATRPHARLSMLVLVLAAALLALAAPAHATGCANAHASRSQQSAETMAAAVVCEINHVRAEHGLRHVQVNGALDTAAQRYAQDMAKRNFFSHVSPNGSTMADRLRRVGYVRSDMAWSIGECLGWGTSSLATPAAMVQQWMNSPEHRAILLTRSWRHVGVGVAGGVPVNGVRGSGATYVADFGVRH